MMVNKIVVNTMNSRHEDDLGTFLNKGVVEPEDGFQAIGGTVSGHLLLAFFKCSLCLLLPQDCNHF